MPEPARERILARLRMQAGPEAAASDFGVLDRRTVPVAERYERLRRRMEENRTEFRESSRETWPAVVRGFLEAEGLRSLLYGPDTPEGRRLAGSWPAGPGPRLVPYDRPLVEAIHDSFWHALRAGVWGPAMPPNALLVSGPSKTADIEQTLAYGVHGPKRLIVVALKPAG
jgi:L-lactate dehydrogenase complex protein LldG